MKKHVVLVNSAFMLKDGTIPGNLVPRDFPLSLGLLATILIRHGYTAEIVNANVHPDWSDRVLLALERDDVAFVGFSCMSSQVYSAIQLSRRIKERFPDIPVVFGGVHATLIPESLVGTPWIDFAVVGEGDAVVVPLVQHLAGELPFERVPNLCKMDGSGMIRFTERAELTTFAALPHDCEESLYASDIEKYVLDVTVNGEKLRGFSILTGLGCNYRCAFCINSITKRKYRSMPARSIVAQMKRLKARHGIRFFNFQEEHFFGDKPRLYALLDLIERDPELHGQIAWNSTIRVSDIRDGFVDVPLLRRLKACGGDGFGVGGESGSDRMLKLLRKGILRKDILRAARFANESAVNLYFSFVMLWPGETFADRVETARLIRDMYEMGPYAGVPYFQTYRPYPGSLWESDLSRFQDPESIPDDIWRFQAISKIKTLPIEKAALTYKLTNTTQVLCLAGMAKRARTHAFALRRMIANALYHLCRWRIQTMNFSLYLEEPLLAYVRDRLAQY